MPDENTISHNIASQMMKSGKHGRLMASDEQKQQFLLTYKKQIIWSIRNVPRGSFAVPAVIAKCLIRYDQKIVKKFCDALNKNLFDGVTDPAYLLWKLLQTNHGKDTVKVYQKTVCAIKAYVEGRKIKLLSTVKKDIFDWEDNYTVPEEFNWDPDKIPDDSIEDIESEEQTLIDKFSVW